MSVGTPGFEPGSVVADRRIDAVAGWGGMGVVYRAMNMRLKRVEAVKVIAEEFARDSSFRQRFELETQAAASIDHPHVVTIYASGEGPGGQLFIAMRYVDGTNLDRLVGLKGRLEPAMAAAIISQAASALDAAHAEELVHRDVKPGNILIIGTDAHYHAYLADFGLAKRASSRTVVSAAGAMVGTIDYMAPEQAEGAAVDLRADVYALGVTLFRALTGDLPYHGEEVARLFAKMSSPPPMVSQVAEGVPPAFDAVIARAMARDPEERYSSAGDFGRAVLAALRRPASGIRSQIAPGAVFADCLLEEVAGEGGMGMVFRARQLKLDRVVAVKVMSKELADDPDFRAQFERECKIAASIDHPNVVPIYWAGEFGHRLYVVMRYVDGGSLREALATRGRLEPERAVEVIEQLAAALDAAHSRGLVHRDIKPGNVLIDSTSGRVLLTDFGLAKAVAETEAADAHLVGTARYSAPETASGNRIDEIRSDIYSMGCVLWDLLGGAERLDLNTVSGVPPALAAVVARATDANPAGRYGSAGELARVARQAISGAPTVPSPGGEVPGPAEAQAVAGRRSSMTMIRKTSQPFAPEPLSTGLTQDVLGLCESVLKLVGEPPAREPLEQLRARLVAPLRLGIAGGSGQERAALVSALLGRPLASALELDVSFVYGTPERVGSSDASGSRSEVALTPEGAIPDEVFSTARASGTPLTVWLPIDALTSISLRALPGTGRSGFPAPHLDEVADAFLVLVSEASAADPDAAHAAVLAELGEARSSAVNAACVFAADDPVRAQPAGAMIKLVLGARVAAVVPFGGTLALAAGLPDAQRRRELLASLAAQGVEVAGELARTGALSDVGLIHRLREVSGTERVADEVAGLQQRADALKARAALARLEQLSYAHPSLAFLRDEVEDLRYASRMHVLDLVDALERCVTQEIEVPEELLGRLERLVTGRTPGARLGIGDQAGAGELARAATGQFQLWKVFENASQASPPARRIAQVVTRSLQLIARGSEPPAAPATVLSDGRV